MIDFERRQQLASPLRHIHALLSIRVRIDPFHIEVYFDGKPIGTAYSYLEAEAIGHAEVTRQSMACHATDTEDATHE